MEALKFMAGDKLRSDIHRWLSPPDPWKNYNIGRESRHEDTGAWFVNGNTLSEWKESGPSSLLWIHGKRQYCPTLSISQIFIVLLFHSGLWQECHLVG
jgi:hypothetical protein